MAGLMIVNGSPRAPRSNSKRYAALVKENWPVSLDVYNVTSKKHEEACHRLEACTDLLLVFPLYADSLPVPLLHFLHVLETHAFARKPTVHVLINCGFLEPEQNQVALDTVRLFCKRNAFPFGSTLCIGAGEAILDTPFVFLVKRQVKKLTQAIRLAKPVQLQVTMPLPKKTFIRASTKYWTAYGARHQISPEQMATMEIEGASP